ncbi:MULTISPECIES: hypothetical protein [Thalassotalea]|uniref:hypothetical protein n=1 Tax=Thalassotalea TaxID=1518149 RepID=UPI000943FA28|nr:MULTISPECIES: hypothetical protein [Thalassotalea]MDO6426155.1 hypothetical protein [Thalassotalea sp. 1_MG-2023]OKY28024.1 hypothetical protein BI291_06200 [Thalassotalea sp. PP2-459]
MSPEQLKKLHSLSQLFRDGQAGSEQVKELSELLASINHHFDPDNDLASEERLTIRNRVN